MGEKLCYITLKKLLGENYIISRLFVIFSLRPTNQLSNLNTNRQMLPAIRDATPINQQNSLMARNNSNTLRYS